MLSHTVTALLISVNFWYERSRRRPRPEGERAKSGRASAGARPDTRTLSISLLSSQFLLGQNAEKTLRAVCRAAYVAHGTSLKTLASFFWIGFLNHLRVWNTGRSTYRRIFTGISLVCPRAAGVPLIVGCCLSGR